MARQECLAERVAISCLKSGNINSKNTERELWQNQFASTNLMLEQINE